MMLWDYMTEILTEFGFMCSWKRYQSTVKKLLTLDRTVTEVLRNLEVRNHLCEVYKLAKLTMVMPATNPTSERIFSLLKLIKTYLQSTMTQGRLRPV